MRENTYQGRLIKRIRVRLPGCLILKNDPEYLQGILDLTILYHSRWAMLEVKASETAPHQPNQDYYVDLANGMSYAAFIYPSNEQAVLDELEQALKSPCRSCVPQP